MDYFAHLWVRRQAWKEDTVVMVCVLLGGGGGETTITCYHEITQR